MSDILIAAIALGVAGLSKGLVGMGLPPIAMGILVLAMPPVEAAAIMVVPALLTNIWQAVAGPSLVPLLKRYGVMFGLTAVATVLAVPALTAAGDISIRVLGALLVLYATYSLARPSLAVSEQAQGWLAPVSGILTGIITGLTGVASMPLVVFLQASGLNRDDLIQALGLSFTVSALALGGGLGAAGALGAVSPYAIGIATVSALATMAIGIRVRKRLNEDVFRRVFLIGLLALGAILVVR